jgi:TRAP-type C4-dicarboxylate transport system permease small subunit
MKRILDVLTKIYQYTGCFVLVAGVILMLIEVFARRVQKSLVPIDEIGNLAMLLLAFAGAPHAFRLGRFIRVRVLYERLPQKVINVFNISHGVLALLFLAYFTFLWVKMILWNYRAGAYMMATGVPYWAPQLIVLVAWLLLLFSLVEYLVRGLSKGSHNRDRLD